MLSRLARNRIVDSRFIGIDVARGIAVLGMFVAHTVPRANDTELLADGRPSILFATLAGLSLGLMTGGDQPTAREARGGRRTQLLLRALVLFLLGVFLSTIDSGVAIILDYYGIMFLLMLPLLFLPRAVLALVGIALLVVMPSVGASLAVDPNSSTALSTIESYLLTGYYPALPWLPLLIAGLIAARSGLRRRRTQFWMLALGSLATVAGYGAAAVIPGVSAEAHSSTTAEILGSGGLAIAVTGLLLLITRWTGNPSRPGLSGVVARGISVSVSPLGAVGALALTVYTAQIVVLALVVAARNDVGIGPVDYPGEPLLVWLSIAALLCATVWRRILGRGPLERALGLMSRG